MQTLYQLHSLASKDHGRKHYDAQQAYQQGLSSTKLDYTPPHQVALRLWRHFSQTNRGLVRQFELPKLKPMLSTKHYVSSSPGTSLSIKRRIPISRNSSLLSR